MRHETHLFNAIRVHARASCIATTLISVHTDIYNISITFDSFQSSYGKYTARPGSKTDCDMSAFGTDSHCHCQNGYVENTQPTDNSYKITIKF